MKTPRLLFLLILLSTLSLQASRQCVDLFPTHLSETERLLLQPEILSVKQSSLFMSASKSGEATTTSARVESKFTLAQQNINRLLKNLKQQIETEIPGFKLINRDALTPGRRNMTWTGYSNRFSLSVDGRKLMAKIRVRKYGLIDVNAEVTKDHFEPIQSMKDMSYFEFKIENPDYENSVLKPRILIKDADANLLLQKNLRAEELLEIKNRCFELNKLEDAKAFESIKLTIEAMILAIRELHTNQSLFRPEYETLYERVSYKIPLTNKTTKENYEIQITLDEDILARSILFNYEAQSYKNSVEKVIVTEVKIPISLTELLQNKNLEQVDGLNAVVSFLDAIETHSLENFTNNSGKLFHLIQELKQFLKK